jgi:hypothetical protein
MDTPGNERRQVLIGLARRNRVDYLVAQHALLRRVLHVHDRRLTGDGDRLLERADSQVGVDRRRKRSSQLDAFAVHRGESNQRKGDGVGARPEVLDPVLAGAIGHARTDLLDQRGTRRFDGHAGQHRARGIAHDARYGCLRIRQGGQTRNERGEEHSAHENPRSAHLEPPECRDLRVR